MSWGEGTKVLLNHEGNLGYGPDQVHGMTLGDLLAAVEDAVEEFGEDAEVLTYQTNNHYGASYGQLSREELFSPVLTDDDDEEVYIDE